MDVAEEYKSSLNDLNFNSKPLINMLTMLAEENKKHASLIVNTIINHINSVSFDSKLPGLYLVDSIIKNIGDEYLKIFCEKIISLFSTVFEKVDESTRSLMFKLRQTWTDVLPNKILYNLDVSVKEMDPAWPVTARNPSKRILINPKFLDGSVEEKKEGDTSLKKEENKMKQKQGEVLKELLAKQEQLRQLELKKLHLTMKKKIATIGSTSSSLNSFAQNNIHDPRMVKINNQNIQVLSQNPRTKSILQGKTSLNTDVASTCAAATTLEKCIKFDMQQQSNNKSKSSMNDCFSEKNIQISNVKPKFLKKNMLKNKCNKPASNKIKLNFSMNKVEGEACSNESVVDFSKISIINENEGNSHSSKKKDLKELAKGLKTSPKKKNAIDSSHQVFYVNRNISVETNKKKHLFFHRRLEKLKSSSNSAVFYIKDKKVNIKNELVCSKDKKININIKHEHVCSKDKNVNMDIKDEHVLSTVNKKSEIKLDKQADLQKPLLQTNDSPKIESVGIETKSDHSDVASILHSDEDLRTNSAPVNEEVMSKRSLKHQIEPSNSVPSTSQVYSPRKKIKNEDIENCNPDYRSGSPILFGNEDQDLRLSKNHSVNDVKSDDWTQYKATHPDEYSPSSGRQEYFRGKFRQRKYHFSGFKPYQREFDRYRHFKYPRGRYACRQMAHQMHFSRPIQRNPVYKSPGTVMIDSHTFLQQAEEKYRSGKISKDEYLDIRRDLQKIANNELQFLTGYAPRIQNAVHYKRQQESQKPREDHENNRNFTVDNLVIQGPGGNASMVKSFVLDGKQKFIHFAEEKALILLENKDPRELTFKNEQRNVYIEGVVKPLTLGFDGKSVEFELDGRHHSIRFGTPGRELYINKHPYEIQFGGLPIAARLEDGHIYRIQLSGPPPQVIIGDTSQYELFNKYHGNTVNFTSKQRADQSIEEMDTEFHLTPESCSLLDIDMRFKPENAPQSGILLNKDSPFYSEEMKDIDWRQIPPTSTNLDSDEKLSSVFQNNMSDSFKIWPQEDNGSFMESKKNKIEKSLKNDSAECEWMTSIQHHPPVHIVNKAEPSPSEQKWHFKESNKTKWQYNHYRQNNFPESKFESEPQSSSVQFYEDNIQVYDGHRSNSYIADFSRESSFQNKHSSGQYYGSLFGPWTSTNEELRQGDHLNQMQSDILNVPQKALLPSPAVTSDYSFSINTSDVLHSTDDTKCASISETLEESTSEIKPSNSNSSDFKVDIESLLEKLISAGIINNKSDEQDTIESLVDPIPDTADDKENDLSAEKITEIEMNAESLKLFHSSVISSLHKGIQCATCGMRFKELKNEHYSNHLDWHFRLNRREKDGVKKAISRRWYYEVEDWIQFEEFENFEEKVPSYFELQAIDNKETEIIEVPPVLSVPATNDDQDFCPVCNERFQLFWVEEEEEWHYRDAVRHENITYHPACYEDYKKTSALEKVKSTNDDPNVFAEIEDLLYSMIEDVVNIRESLSSDIKNVPSDEIYLEEEILEGKPGEEEIIGLISESDIEMEIHSPKTDSKIIIMQSGGITLKVKAESLQCHSPSNPSEKETKLVDDKPIEDEEYNFRPPTPDPNFEVRPLVSRGRELSGLCCIM